MAMASEAKTVLIVPLNGSNYATWKIRCKMALMRDNMWSIVDETEKDPEGDAERAKFKGRKDKALVAIVLAVDPSLVYLLGESGDLVEVWKKSASQFQGETCASKLSLWL